MAPLVAFVAVLLVAIGGFWVAGRLTGADRTVGLVTERRDQPAGTETAAPDPAQQDDPGSRDGRGVPLPALGTVAANPSTAGPTTPAPATSRSGAPAPPAQPRSTTSAAPPATPVPTGTPAPSSAPADLAMADEVTRLTNVERSKAGCRPVRVDSRLAAAALAHSRDMVDRDYFDHTSPDGLGPGDRAEAAGYPRWSGENIAAGYSTAAAVMQGWMDSPEHRANILNCDSKATGVGFDPRGNMWTQRFGYV